MILNITLRDIVPAEWTAIGLHSVTFLKLVKQKGIGFNDDDVPIWNDRIVFIDDGIAPEHDGTKITYFVADYTDGSVGQKIAIPN